MPRKPKHPSQGGRPAAERQLASGAPVRQFVDREEFIAPVQAALKEPQRIKPLVLVYYGGAGIGKSRLRRELVKQFASDPGVVAAVLDFDLPIYRQPDAALLFLRNALHQTYGAKFPSFDIAYACLWQKAHPDAPLRSEEGGERREEAQDQNDERWTMNEKRGMLEQGSLLLQLLDESGKLPLIGLIPKVSALVDSRQNTVDREWWTRRGERELEDLPQMEPGAVVGQLPRLWAEDLKDHLRSESPESIVQSPEARSRSAVLFVDSYEKLWGTGDSRQQTVDSRQVTVDGRQKTDEWVRELVKQLPEALWVICGRQKLRWEEVDKDWGESLSQHELGALPDKSARRFLESCGITNEPIQDAIVKGSQGVPHYLDLAVDTLQSSAVGVRSSEFEGASPNELVKQFVRHLDQPEIETLQVLSGPRFWYYELFENLMTEYQTGYPATAYEDLARFSFIKEGAAPGTRTMHDLMREALQEEQSPELRKRVHLFLFELYAKRLEGLDVKGITEKHKVALTEAFYHGRQAKNASELWAWFGAASDVFGKAGQFRLLIPLYRQMVQALDTELGPSHSDAATALHVLAVELTKQGEYSEAEPLFRRALTVFETKLDPEHSLVCDCLVWLTRLLRNQARYDEAEAVCRRAVDAFDKPGKNATARAEALGDLGEVLMEERKYAEAEELLWRALAICEKELGPDHHLTADDVNSLAVLFWNQGRQAEAEPLARRALAIKEKNLGANHPDLTCLLDNLANILHCLRRFPEAEALLRRSLRLSEETLGPGHPDTAVTAHNLGSLFREQGRHAEAEPLLRRAMAAHEMKMGPGHPFTLRMAKALVTVLAGQGKYAEAEPMVLSAVANSEKSLGPDHPETAQALHTAGLLYREQGRYAEAETYLRRGLEISTKANGPEHSNTFGALGALAVLQERWGRYAEAESLYRDVLEKRTRVLGSEHPDVAATANRLAGICCRDGRYAEAEALYRRALAIREKVFGPEHTFVAEVLDGLTNVCEQTGRAAEAQEFSARAKRIHAQAQAASEKTVDSRQ